MRFFEIVLVAAILVFAWWTVVSGRPRRPLADLFGVIGVGGVAGLQWFVEGYRWQVVPLYAVAAIVVVVSLWDLVSPTDAEVSRRRSSRGAGWGTVGVAALTVVPLALPVVDLPSPGETPVGTVSFTAADNTRIETYGLNPGGDREVAVQIWYPAASSDGVEAAPWVDDIEAMAPTASEYLGFPPFFLDHLELSATNSYLAAPAADGRFPVIVYSHGWGGFRSVALNQMEALAARGFVVVAIDHTFAALSTTLSDGVARRIDVNALPEESDVTREEYEAARELLSLTFTEDIWFVLDQLEIVDRGGVASASTVAGHMDLGRIGILGHSTGGGAAVTACLGDPRCDAVLGQDPWLEPVPATVIERGIAVPFLAIRSEEWLGRPNEALLMDLIEASGESSASAYIDDTVHRDFTLLPLVSPIASLAGLSGSLATDRTFEIVDAVNIAFFEEHLAGGAPFRQRLSGFGELQLDDI